MLCDSIFNPVKTDSPTDIYTQSVDEKSNQTTMYEDIDENCTCEFCEYQRNTVGQVSFIGYDLEEEQNQEKLQNEYHINKDHGDWYYAKMIISHAYQDKNNAVFFWDHLEKQMLKNGDGFENIITAYYKNDLDIDIVYQFAKEPAKHLIDNLRIPAFKPDGIIFSNREDANKWSFKIVVITSKGIYSANRYITEDLIGCY